MASDLDKESLPSFHFSAALRPERQRFDAWAGEVAPLFDVAPASEPRPFRGAIQAYLLDGIVVGQSQFSGQEYRRDRRLVARTGLDAYLVQLYTKGGFDGRADATEMSVRAGDICIFDLTATLATRAMESATITLVIPKPLVDSRWRAQASVHGMTVSGGSVLGQLLGAHLVSLVKAMPLVSAAEAPLVAETTAQMVASCLAQGAGESDAVQGLSQQALHDRAMLYICRHLHSPDLSPASICAALNVSRPHLYRAFRDRGGIARSIIEQRLRMAFAELANPARRKDTIGSIAFRCGFTSQPHFTRTFQEAFGLRPSDVRDGPPPMVETVARPGLPAWLAPAAFGARQD